MTEPRNYFTYTMRMLSDQLAVQDTADPVREIAAEGELLRFYTLLVLVKGPRVTAQDVHDAWVACRFRSRPGHPDLVPFAQLTAEAAAYDEPYVKAIKATAEALAWVCTACFNSLRAGGCDIPRCHCPM